MKLQEIFDQLTHGELSQISFGGGEAGVIAPSNYSKVVSHVNLGLTSLHKRFPLKEGRVGLQLVPGITTYNITSKFALNSRSTREPVKYVIDTVDAPFKDDIHKIERVLTSDGYELPLNDGSDMYSLYTPTVARLRIPEVIVAQSIDLPDQFKTETLEIVYRANHVKINPEDLMPDEVEVHLPESHVEALLYYIASRCHNPVGLQTEFQIGSAYSAKYEQACQELERFNLLVDQGSQNTRLANGGWV